MYFGRIIYISDGTRFFALIFARGAVRFDPIRASLCLFPRNPPPPHIRAPPCLCLDQASFGLLSMLDSPLFHIYVLGREAKGNLARPFKQQGLMASLSGPMEAMTAKVTVACCC